jgi:Putative stress-responsive transcriptional regulator
MIPMAPVDRSSDDGAMTNDQPGAALRSDQSTTARQLRRRTSDRVMGGVASGLGDYVNVDPVLVRAASSG